MIPLYSKSSDSVFDRCPRSYFLAYEECGTGLKTGSTGLELHLGTSIHDALALIAIRHQTGEDINIDEIASTANAQVYAPIAGDESSPEKIEFAREQACLIEGLIRGFYKHTWPILMANYAILAIELPCLYRHSGKAMMTKGDIILQSNDGIITYLEYKSTGSKKEEWMNSWEKSPQIHTTIAALKQQHNIDVDAAIVQGLYKGFQMKGSQTSIFCYGYRRGGTPPFTRENISYVWTNGARKFPVWEMEGGCKEWVNRMPANILSDQFPQTKPIFYNEQLAMDYFAQRSNRQDDITYAKALLSTGVDKDEVLNRYFLQDFNQCIPPYGRACMYNPICHGNAKADPLASGFVQRTTDHQEIFVNLLTQEEKDA